MRNLKMVRGSLPGVGGNGEASCFERNREVLS